MQIETLAELLAHDKETDWLATQEATDLHRLVDRLIDMELAADPEDLDDVQGQLDAFEAEENDSRGTLETVHDMVKSGRVDDAMLLIERTLWPRRNLPMRQERAA